MWCGARHSINTCQCCICLLLAVVLLRLVLLRLGPPPPPPPPRTMMPYAVKIIRVSPKMNTNQKNLAASAAKPTILQATA